MSSEANLNQSYELANLTAPLLEHREELQALSRANIAAGKPPYTGVKIQTYGELLWMMTEQGWSGEVEAVSRANFQGVYLSGVNLKGAVLNGVDFTNAILDRADLSSAVLSGADFTNAILNKANLSDATLVWADLSNANLEGANLNRADLVGATLHGTSLGGANCCDTHFERADLSNALLAKAILRGAILTESDLSYALLIGADLRDAQLDRADLRGARLEDATLSKAFMPNVKLNDAFLAAANLNGATLTNADLTGAILASSNLKGTVLTKATLNGADIREAHMDATTRFIEVRLDGNTKLGDIVWNDASLIRVDWDQLERVGDESVIQSNLKPLSSFLQSIRTASKISTTKPIQTFMVYLVEYRKRLAKVYRDVARAYHGLSIVLAEQGLSVPASRYRLRKQQLERKALFWECKVRGWLFSGLLDLVAGYGELPHRAVRAYALVVFGFACCDWFVTNFCETKLSHLRWDEALVLSVTSFHGRGFFPGTLSLGDWVARLGAFEAIIGLFIEVIFIATFSRRFLEN